MNTGGVALTVFELLTASFAADNFQLRDDWNAREKRLKSQHPVLRNLQSDDFLQAISLLVTQTRRREALRAGITTDNAPGISCKRKDILKLEVADWQAWATASKLASYVPRASLRTEDLQGTGPALPHPARTARRHLRGPRQGRRD